MIGPMWNVLGAVISGLAFVCVALWMFAGCNDECDLATKENRHISDGTALGILIGIIFLAVGIWRLYAAWQGYGATLPGWEGDLTPADAGRKVIYHRTYCKREEGVLSSWSEGLHAIWVRFKGPCGERCDPQDVSFAVEPDLPPRTCAACSNSVSHPGVYCRGCRECEK